MSSPSLSNYATCSDHSHDTEMTIPAPEINSTQNDRVVISIDFGTTFSTVSYLLIPSHTSVEDVSVDSVTTISGYPDCWDASSSLNFQVPTAVLYSLKPNDIYVFDEPDPELGSQNLGSDPIDPATFSWGYSLKIFAETNKNNPSISLHNFKLLLDDNPSTAEIRRDLEGKIAYLQEHRIISSKWDVITHYLTALLRHTKKQLVLAQRDRPHKEIVLCVPAIWTQKSCRIMQTCLSAAMQASQLGGLTQNSVGDFKNSRVYIDNFFLVSEPEAAAAKVLHQDRYGLREGDIFIVLDAGGGTVDISSYQVSNTMPLCLEREMQPPYGALHGSSFVNENFRLYCGGMLRHEEYLFQVDEVFETRAKRLFSGENNRWTIRVSGLRDDADGFFRCQYFVLRSPEMRDFFQEHLDGIWDALDSQIQALTTQRAPAHKIIAVGGFSNSPYLQNFLQEKINDHNSNTSYPLSLALPDQTRGWVDVVSAGGIIRSLSKEHGPSRTLQCSYGLLRDEQYMVHAEHEIYKPYRDPLDGFLWIRKTILWFLVKDTELPSEGHVQDIFCTHTFDLRRRQQLKCKEQLYVTDADSPQSHFKARDEKNCHAELVGDIVVDFTPLRDSGELRPVIPAKGEGKPHYSIEYRLRLTVMGRHLKCEAIYKGQVMESCHLNIAPAFL